MYVFDGCCWNRAQFELGILSFGNNVIHLSLRQAREDVIDDLEENNVSKCADMPTLLMTQYSKKSAK